MFRLKYQLYLSIYTGTTKCQIPTKWHVEVVFLNHFSHFSKKLITGDTYNNMFQLIIHMILPQRNVVEKSYFQV